MDDLLATKPPLDALLAAFVVAPPFKAGDETITPQRHLNMSM